MQKLILISLCSLLLISCQATVNTLDNTEKTMQATSIDTSKVSTDGFLKDRLDIIRVDKKQRDDGLLSIQVTAQNIRTSFWSQASSWFMGDNPYQIAYRFTWFDADGMEVETATSTWVPLIVIPGDTVRLKAISPSAQCKDFSLAIRENEGGRK